MKSRFALVLVTAPSLHTARALARSTLEARLAACVNLIPSIESHYWWEDKLESGREILLLIKTTVNRLPSLRKHIQEEHPYDTPEFLALPVPQGAKRYLDWIAASARVRGRPQAIGSQPRDSKSPSRRAKLRVADLSPDKQNAV